MTPTDPDFSTVEWDRLTPEVEVAFNLLRATRVNPKLFPYAYIFG